MFIELAEFLRCPEPHRETFLVVAPDEMAGRMVLRGTIGCPICQREYAIERGVARFGEAPETPDAAATADADVAWALLGLSSPGGYVVLVGSATRLAAPLAGRMGGIHFVGVNPPQGVEATPTLSLVAHADRIPLRDAMARGVVLGVASVREPWINEGARVLLPGLRLIAATESLSVAGLTQLAAGRGFWVGQKSPQPSASSG